MSGGFFARAQVLPGTPGGPSGEQLAAQSQGMLILLDHRGVLDSNLLRPVPPGPAGQEGHYAGHGSPDPGLGSNAGGQSSTLSRYPWDMMPGLAKATANRRNSARAPLQGLMSRTRSGRSTMAQKGEQTRTSRLTRRRRPPHRWLETASMPSTGLGQRRTILIYSEPHPRALISEMFTSRRRGSPQVPRALRGTPTAPACPRVPRARKGAGG